MSNRYGGELRPFWPEDVDARAADASGTLAEEGPGDWPSRDIARVFEELADPQAEIVDRWGLLHLGRAGESVVMVQEAFLGGVGVPAERFLERCAPEEYRAMQQRGEAAAAYQASIGGYRLLVRTVEEGVNAREDAPQLPPANLLPWAREKEILAELGLSVFEARERCAL